MAQNTGTLVGAAIRPADSNDEFPSAFANELKGGHHSVATIAERNAITTPRREFGMTCFVRESGKEYRLVNAENGGADNDISNNANWIEAVGGDGGLELGETSTTAGRGDYTKTAYDHSQETGNPHGTKFSELEEVPSTFPPAAHSHEFSELEGLPSTFPPTAHSHDMSEIRGGHHSVDAVSDRDAIPSNRREFGMTCFVRESGKEYRLVSVANGGVDNNISNNENWIETGVPTSQGSGAFTIISTVKFETAGTYASDNQKVTASPTPEAPLEFKYEDTTFVIDEEINLPTAIDTDLYIRADAIVLTPDGTVELIEGEQLEIEAGEQALIYPFVPNDKHLLSYVHWRSTGGSVEPPSLRLSQFVNDVPYATHTDVVEIFNERVRTYITVKNSNFTLSQNDNRRIVISNGFTATINPDTQDYSDYIVALMNDASTLDMNIILTAVSGWTYSVNGENMSSGTLMLGKGMTCSILKKPETQKIIISGTFN